MHVVDFAFSRAHRHDRTRRAGGSRLRDGACLGDAVHWLIIVRVLNLATKSTEAATTHPATHMVIGSFRRTILNSALFCCSTLHDVFLLGCDAAAAL